MMYGVGVDIAKVSRFTKWVVKEDLVSRFFNEEEIIDSGSLNYKCEHYASRFAVKEAFSKALGTGFQGFKLREIATVKDEDEKPFAKFSGDAKRILFEKCGENAKVHISLSHEKEYAIAFVVIEV